MKVGRRSTVGIPKLLIPLACVQSYLLRYRLCSGTTCSRSNLQLIPTVFFSSCFELLRRFLSFFLLVFFDRLVDDGLVLVHSIFGFCPRPWVRCDLLPVILPQRDSLTHSERTKQCLGQAFLKFNVFALLDVTMSELVTDIAVIWINSLCLFQI